MNIYTTTLKESDDGVVKGFAETTNRVLTQEKDSKAATIYLDEQRIYQKIDGFGVSLTEASAFLCKQVVADPDQLIRELFTRETGLGLSFLRQPLGPTDHVSKPYSFVQETPDKALTSLDFSFEKNEILPFVKKAYAAAKGQLRIMVSPWSAPNWMKENNSWLGIEKERGVPGFLKEEYYSTFAEYIVKFVEFYEENQLPIFAVTPLNEPDFANYVWPSMPMTCQQQRTFIVDYLAPQLKKSLYQPKLMCWDHNFDSFNYKEGAYVKTLYQDPEILKLVAGSAWHWYEGAPETLRKIKKQFPTQEIWITEASGGDWGYRQWREAFFHQAKMAIELMRNEAQSLIYWNMALDTQGGPDYYYQKNQGVHSENRGLVTVDPVTGAYTPNCDYYTLGHFSKFVPLGSQRIYSSNPSASGIENVAFKRPDGKKVLVIFNAKAQEQVVVLNTGTKEYTVRLEPASLNTVIWQEQDFSTEKSLLVFDSQHRNLSTIHCPKTLQLSDIQTPIEKAGLLVTITSSYFKEGADQLLIEVTPTLANDAQKKQYPFLTIIGQNLRYYAGQQVKVTVYNDKNESETLQTKTALAYNEWSHAWIDLSELTMELGAIRTIGLSFLGKDRDLYLIKQVAFTYTEE